MYLLAAMREPQLVADWPVIELAVHYSLLE